MPVDPFLTPFLPLPSLPAVIDDWDAYREAGRAQSGEILAQTAQPAPAGVETTRVTMPVDGGSITLSVHRPVDAQGVLPGHLYLHGGGWVAGDGDAPAVDITCAERAVGARCVVVAADYRKAPEHPFPTGLEDCHAALRWMVANAAEWGIDPDRIAVGGGSAGGNLAAALSLKARDEGGPAICFQLLEVPALDLTSSLPSHGDESLGRDYALSRADVDRLIPLYAKDIDPAHPYLSPLLAEDLTGLPPAHLMSAEFDLLRDDGAAYARRLTEAGVRATSSLGAGHVHVSPAFTLAMPTARTWRDEAVAVLSAALHSRRG